MKCPVCGAREFFVKDPDDPFSAYEFELKDDAAVFADRTQEEEAPELTGAIETYCTRCAWHDRMDKLK